GLEPAPIVDLQLRVGTHAVAARIFGRRRWQRRWIRGTQISAPEPFSTMPLDWTYAFGGRADVGGRRVPNLDNPLGRGYVLDEQAVDGVELPNIEEPERLIRHWTDMPRPLAFSP